MDAKSKANFINSVAGGQKIPCPSCNALNDVGDLFCFSCGTKLMKENANPSVEVCIGQVSGTIPCPACKTLNEPDSLFCSNCGTKLKKNDVDNLTEAVVNPVNTEDIPLTEETSKPAFASVKRPMAASRPMATAKEPENTPQAEKKTVFQFAATEPVVEDPPISVFAQGLPSWDIVPPQVMVRRKKNK